jgi:hypothetical protein
MKRSPTMPKAADQHRRFIETARALECDEDKERFEAKLKQIAGHRPREDQSMTFLVKRIGYDGQTTTSSEYGGLIEALDHAALAVAEGDKDAWIENEQGARVADRARIERHWAERSKKP